MKSQKMVAIALAGVLSLGAVLQAGPDEKRAAVPLAPGSGQVTVFLNVRVFDGKKIIPRSTVVVKGSKIAAVGPGVTVPQGAKIISGKNLTLLPGLIDSHVHLLSLDSLRQNAFLGVTTVLDMMTSPDFVKQAKTRLQDAGGKALADFRSAGNPATCPGGHGTEWGTQIPTLTKPEEAAAFIGDRIAEGSDYIKIMSGMVRNVLPLDVIAALVQEAKKRGLLTLVHIETRSTALAAIRAGVNGLAHCFADSPPDDDFIAAMKAAGSFVIPTLSVMNRLKDARKIDIAADERLAAGLEPEVIHSLESAQYPPDSSNLFYLVAEETVRRLHRAGIPVLAGSDAGKPGTVHGASLLGELELMIQAGFSPLEALIAATSLPAGVFGLRDRGRIAPGLAADLLLVTGDPSRLITDTRNIAGVWLRGERLDRNAVRTDMNRLREEWRKSGDVPAPRGSEAGLMCNFAGGDYLTRFGMYLFPISDKMMGGVSGAAISLAAGGADGSPGALAVTGNIEAKSPMPWAGVAFFPGALMMSIANLSRWDAITFWVKGDCENGAVMTMRDKQQMPGFAAFPVTRNWQKISISFRELGSSDGKNIWAFVFGAANTPGKFTILLDDVRLVATPKQK